MIVGRFCHSSIEQQGMHSNLHNAIIAVRMAKPHGDSSDTGLLSACLAKQQISRERCVLKILHWA